MSNYRNQKVKQTLGFPIEPGIPMIDRITVSRKLPPDKSNFITTLKIHEPSNIKCRKCGAVHYFEHVIQEPHEVKVREFKLAHSHTSEATPEPQKPSEP